ncbi:MAG: hypothetical protein KJ062_08310 [Thermoanaerobaculia bacterium]|nr:hypothetical protein [Thermoanaerobaculia bacterium]
MGVTIHYYTEAGRGLSPETAEGQFERAVALTTEIGTRLGWKFRGRFREENRRYTEFAPKGGSRDGTGTIRMALWDPDPGCETFGLEWVEGTGILPYAFVKTQYADDRVRVHAGIITLLDRLNREVFDGRLLIHDEGGFYQGGSLDALAGGFAENEEVLRHVLRAIQGQGWSIGRPADRQSGTDATDTDR